jgi:hypothetical protein
VAAPPGTTPFRSRAVGCKRLERTGARAYLRPVHDPLAGATLAWNPAAHSPLSRRPSKAVVALLIVSPVGVILPLALMSAGVFWPLVVEPLAAAKVGVLGIGLEVALGWLYIVRHRRRNRVQIDASGDVVRFSSSWGALAFSRSATSATLETRRRREQGWLGPKERAQTWLTLRGPSDVLTIGAPALSGAASEGEDQPIYVCDDTVLRALAARFDVKQG